MPYLSVTSLGKTKDGAIALVHKSIGNCGEASGLAHRTVGARGGGGARDMGRERKCRSHSAGSWRLAEEGSRQRWAKNQVEQVVFIMDEGVHQGALDEAHTCFWSSFCLPLAPGIDMRY